MMKWKSWQNVIGHFAFAFAFALIRIGMDYGFAADFPHRTQMPFVQIAIHPRPLNQTIRCS